MRMEDYLDQIGKDPPSRAACERCLTVTISRFFRDRKLWEHLQQHILPALIDRFPHGLAAWSAGCAGGEEPYSLAMIWEELAATVRPSVPFYVLATDAAATCLQRAEAGVYSASSLKEIPEKLSTRWFRKVPGGRQWRIDSKLKAHITWQVHHLLEKPPQGPFHLIFLRNNLLTYYQGRQMEAALANIVATLANDGVLILGSRERLAYTAFEWIRDPIYPWVYYGHGFGRGKIL